MEQNKVIDISDFDSQDDDELSEEPARGDSLHKENTQRRADTLELLPVSESSNSWHKASVAAKPTNWKIESEEENEVDQSECMALERIKVHPSRKPFFPPEV